MASSRLEHLSSQIAENTKTVNDYLKASSKKLSFEVDSEPAFPSDAPNEVLTARRAVREATKELYELMTGPAEHLRWLACNHHDQSSLRFIYHFKIADAVPLDGKISFKELAEKAGVDEKRLKTVIRHAMTNNIFYEPEAGYVAHTADSSLLVKQKGVRDWVGYTCEETYPASAKFVEATKKWRSSSSPTETAYNMAFDTPLPMFEHMAKDPERVERFANVMVELTSTDGYNIRHLVNGFDWAGLPDGATVVDVGGSTGHASMTIAKEAKQLNFIVQDREEVVENGKALLASETDEDLKKRIQFEAYDFFTTQPRHGAAIYLFRFIFHDYPDEIAVKILKSVVPALKPDSRLVVMDGVLPEPNTIPKSEERIIRIMDLEMTTTYNAGEREKANWEALFAKADERLKLKAVRKPEGSVSSVMEVVFEP